MLREVAVADWNASPGFTQQTWESTGLEVHKEDWQACAASQSRRH